MKNIIVKIKSMLLHLQGYIHEHGYKQTIKKIISLDFNTKNIPIYNDTNGELLSFNQFLEADKNSKVNMNYWAFPVCAYDHTLSGNDRAIFEEIKSNPNIKKIILTRTKEISLEGNNVEIIPLESSLGQKHLLECGIIFIKHSPKINAIYPLDPIKHKFINLWHGIPLKRIGSASLDLQNKQEILAKENIKNHCVISSSLIDKMAMATAFTPLTYNDIWLTGLPRHDFILKDKNELPIDFQEELQKLDRLVDGKKLILYAPTFRNNQANGYYQFSKEEQEKLTHYLKENNLILGIREHMADSNHSYTNRLSGDTIINLNSEFFPDIEILYKKADLLITDYSSCFIDFMLTNKPMISFAYDAQNYSQKERGFFYKLEDVFPGEITYTFEQLLNALHNIISKNSSIDDSYPLKQKIFFEYMDSNNSKRVIEKIENEIK